MRVKRLIDNIAGLLQSFVMSVRKTIGVFVAEILLYPRAEGCAVVALSRDFTFRRRCFSVIISLYIWPEIFASHTNYPVGNGEALIFANQ